MKLEAMNISFQYDNGNRKILKFMNQDVTKELMKKLFAEIKINVKTAKAIKNDLHET